MWGRKRRYSIKDKQSKKKQRAKDAECTPTLMLWQPISDIQIKYQLYFHYFLHLQDELASASASLCINFCQYFQTMVLMTHGCHRFRAEPIKGHCRYEHALNTTQNNKFLGFFAGYVAWSSF